MLGEWIMNPIKKEMEFCLQTTDSHNLQGLSGWNRPYQPDATL